MGPDQLHVDTGIPTRVLQVPLPLSHLPSPSMLFLGQPASHVLPLTCSSASLFPCPEAALRSYSRFFTSHPKRSAKGNIPGSTAVPLFGVLFLSSFFQRPYIFHFSSMSVIFHQYCKVLYSFPYPLLTFLTPGVLREVLGILYLFQCYPNSNTFILPSISHLLSRRSHVIFLHHHTFINLKSPPQRTVLSI